KAIYVLDNQAKNAVIAVPVGADGFLDTAAGSTTLTGGAGASAINAATNESAGPDALFSQSALAVSGNTLFAVNPGSNSLSMFTIDPRDATKLTLLGQPVPLPGDFPNTVAVSAQNKLACVGLTGASAGISCVSFDASSGCSEADDLRALDLGQTTPPVGPTNTVSQVFFSADESTLFATVKGNPAVNNTGFLASYAITSNNTAGPSVAATGQQSSPPNTAMLFGAATIPGSTTSLFIADPSFGAAVIGVQQQESTKGTGQTVLSTSAEAVVPGQKAICWLTISPATGTAFLADGGLDRLVEVSPGNATILGEIDLSANGDPGLIDIGAAGVFLYALSPGNGTTDAAVTVVSTKTMSQVQHADLSGLGGSKSAQGIAIL
ncbi:hypothetical protein M406DRAFT_230663, partial [Cryphonectria parasitica EP155]